MQEATEQTVLGDFNNATLTHFGITSSFYRKDRKFFVRTDGPDGTLHDYEVAYDSRRRRAALDGDEPDLELHVRRLPFDEPAAELRSFDQQLSFDMV